MKHSEFGYIAIWRDTKKQKPHFAIATLHWTAKAARHEFMGGLPVTWAAMKQRGWRIVKVKVKEC